jgi:hypothetical protein
MSPASPKPLPGSGRLERRQRKAARQVVTKREERQNKRDQIEAYRAIRWAVFQRDGGRDRAFGTPLVFEGSDVATTSHAHHVTFRSHGGTDTTDNLVTLSNATHDLIHKPTREVLTIDGNADGTLSFTLKNLETGNVIRTWESTL